MQTAECRSAASCRSVTQIGHVTWPRAGLQNAECRMQNADRPRGVAPRAGLRGHETAKSHRAAECRMQNAECRSAARRGPACGALAGLQNAECRMQNADRPRGVAACRALGTRRLSPTGLQNAECRMQNADGPRGVAMCRAARSPETKSHRAAECRMQNAECRWAARDRERDVLGRKIVA